jgi:hypothetical protein
MDWVDRKPEDWIGKTIVSQYGLVCEVTGAREVDGKIMLCCLARYKSKVWNWTTDTVSLVTKAGEMLDANGEIFGKIRGDHWDLYPDEECRVISQGDINMEFMSP